MKEIVNNCEFIIPKSFDTQLEESMENPLNKGIFLDKGFKNKYKYVVGISRKTSNIIYFENPEEEFLT